MFSSNASQVSTAATYIEDVFSTYLYTGTGASQTITNGVDLSTKGGLVWIKSRSGSSGHFLTDSNIVAQQKYISSSSTNAAADWGSRFSVFLNNGFRLGADDSTTFTANASGTTYASWSFRKQAKFFDVVTYTGNGAYRTISHKLGSTPGCIIVKRTDAVADWPVYHRGTGAGRFNWATLNTTAAFSAESTIWNDTAPTSTVFSVGTATAVNANGGTYVAYLFAHDAGGFGATGSDNVISCGSFTTDGSGNATVNLGYEPQWILNKSATTSASWGIIDTMRGFGVSSDAYLMPNSINAEGTGWGLGITSTGFKTAISLSINTTYIYIAIRRGPMKTPTTGTSVFYPNAVSLASTIDSTNVPFPPDLVTTFSRNGTNRTSAFDQFLLLDRLRGLGTPNNTLVAAGLGLVSSSTNSEVAASSTYVQLKADSQNITRGGGWNDPQYGNWIYYFMRRAPGFFDVVCYTGTGSATTFSHNLGVAPELMIFKGRNFVSNWRVYSAAIWGTGFVAPGFDLLSLNANSAANINNNLLNSTQPTASVFSVGTSSDTNGSGNTYVAYLFATVAGVSKVGSYTGTGTTKQIDCGFTGGARFVLIKRADSTGDWYVWDSARGIVAGNDPYLLLNSTAAEVTSTDYVDTYSAGFEISSTAPAAINANGGTFIFLAIA